MKCDYNTHIYVYKNKSKFFAEDHFVQRMNITTI